MDLELVATKFVSNSRFKPNPPEEDRTYAIMRGIKYGFLEEFFEQGMTSPTYFFFDPENNIDEDGKFSLDGLIKINTNDRIEVYDLGGDLLVDIVAQSNISDLSKSDFLNNYPSLNPRYFRIGLPATYTPAAIN